MSLAIPSEAKASSLNLTESNPVLLALVRQFLILLSMDLASCNKLSNGIFGTLTRFERVVLTAVLLTHGFNCLMRMLFQLAILFRAACLFWNEANQVQ